MPAPKSGNAGTAVDPSNPQPALEADHADPGQVEKVRAEQLQTKTGKYGTVPANAHKPPQSAADKAKKPHWIEIVLVDKDNQPVPGEAYRITLPDGQTVATGTLDEKGLARVEGIDPGTCRVTFTNLEKQAWQPK